MAGYLKVVSFRINKDGKNICNCVIPNKEVQILYHDVITSWLGVHDDSILWHRDLTGSLLSCDIDNFKDNFG